MSDCVPFGAELPLQMQKTSTRFMSLSGAQTMSSPSSGSVLSFGNGGIVATVATANGSLSSHVELAAPEEFIILFDRSTNTFQLIQSECVKNLVETRGQTRYS